MQQTLCVFVGTYTQPIRFGTGQLLEGKGQGIHAYTMDENSGTLKERFVAKGIDNPSYLAFSADKTHLYAVNELKRFQNQDSGAVSAFRLDKQASGLTFLNQQPTQGTDPCHVTLNAAQTHVYVSNFMSGSVSVFPIAPDGSLQDSCCFLQHHGSSVHPRRQTGPHAHSLVFTPDQRYALVPDLGLDRLMVYVPDSESGKLSPAPIPYFQTAPGSGPRHCVFHPNGKICYLINELGSSITVLRYDAAQGAFTAVQTVPSVVVPFDPESNICACIKMTPDGRFLYGSNRGQDTLVAYAVDPAGTLTYIDTFSSEGKTPRDFEIDPTGRFLLCGNQDSDCIAVFSIAPQTGELSLVSRCDAPTPVCIKPVFLQDAPAALA